MAEFATDGSAVLFNVPNTEAFRFVRKMHGGSQAHLIEATDGHSYVVKFQNNPQHRRTLVNEWISSALLSYMELPTPLVATVQLTEKFLEANRDTYIALARRHLAPTLGAHFGSRFPSHPSQRVVVYDFIPDALLDRVENVADFAGVLAFDSWIGNGDSRQVIFLRTSSGGLAKTKSDFVAQMIDNGQAFQGREWQLRDAPTQCLYFRPLVYQRVCGLADFGPWLERIKRLPEWVVGRALQELPPAWIAGDQEHLDRLLERLMRRRERVPGLIERSREARTDYFPAWN